MKLSILFSSAALYTAATAWKLQFHTRANIGMNMHGTLDADCRTIGWGPNGGVKQDVDYIYFDPETPNWPDPDTVTVYPGQWCGEGGVSFGGGVHKPNPGFWVGSYSVE